MSPFPPVARLNKHYRENTLKNYESNKEYKKSQAYKTKRNVKCRKLYNLYEEHHEEVKYQKISCYLNLEAEAREKNNLNTIIPNQVIKHYHI